MYESLFQYKKLGLKYNETKQYRNKTLKLCYEQGENILVSCSQGHVDIYNKSIVSMELTCNLKQGWLPNKCIFCEKVICPWPQSENKTYEGIVMLTFLCYLFAKNIHLLMYKLV